MCENLISVRKYQIAYYFLYQDSTLKLNWIQWNNSAIEFLELSLQTVFRLREFVSS